MELLQKAKAKASGTRKGPTFTNVENADENGGTAAPAKRVHCCSRRGQREASSPVVVFGMITNFMTPLVFAYWMVRVVAAGHADPVTGILLAIVWMSSVLAPKLSGAAQTVRARLVEYEEELRMRHAVATDERLAEVLADAETERLEGKCASLARMFGPAPAPPPPALRAESPTCAAGAGPGLPSSLPLSSPVAERCTSPVLPPPRSAHEEMAAWGAARNSRARPPADPELAAKPAYLLGELEGNDAMLDLGASIGSIGSCCSSCCDLTELDVEPSADEPGAKHPKLGTRPVCAECDRRLPLTACFCPCKCGRFFCAAHRHSHTCSFDHRRSGSREVSEANPKLKASKVERIE